MAGYYDIYVLAQERSAELAENFLNAFAPEREQSATEYEFPEYSERPTVVFQSATEAIRYCATHSNETHRFYFRNLRASPAHAMLFFTSDGGLILGLSVSAGRGANVELGWGDEWFTRLKHFAGSTIGYITFETPPADTVAEFKVMVERIERQEELRGTR